MNIENTEPTTISNNPEICETFHCRLCKQYKAKDNFYKYTRNIENRIVREEYFSVLCKECLPIEALYWSAAEDKPKIDQKILTEFFKNKQKEKLYKEHGLKLEDLIPRSGVMKILNLDDNSKEWLKNKVNMGIIKEFLIGDNPGDYSKGGKGEINYYKYYLPSDIEMLKFIKEHGFLICRGRNSINKGNIGTNNPPYQFINNKGKHFLFVNLTEQKKTCVVCCQYKLFNEFDVSSVTKDGKTNLCKECAAKENKTKYDSLSQEDRDIRSEKSSNYIRNNREKVNLSNKKWKKNNPKKYKIRRNLKSRIKKLLKAKQLNNIEYLEKIKNNIYILPSSEKMLGIHPSKFLDYIESKFLPGMTWENYGTGFARNANGKILRDKDGNAKFIQEWQIDHIKCIDSFDLSKEEDLMAINHYTNLLPMWAEDNNYKREKTELCIIKDKWLIDKYKELEILIKNNKYDNSTN